MNLKFNDLEIDEIEMTLIPYMGKTIKFVEILINSLLKENGIDLTKNQFILLKVVNNGPLPQTSLSMITECNKSSLTRLVTALENKDMVKRKASKEDKRINTVVITEKGNRVFQKASPIIESVFDKIQNGVSIENRELLQEVMKKIMQNSKNEIEKLSKDI